MSLIVSCVSEDTEKTMLKHGCEKEQAVQVF